MIFGRLVSPMLAGYRAALMTVISEPDEGKLHAQFDDEVEVSGQTPRWAPPLYSTPHVQFVVAGRAWRPEAENSGDRKNRQ